MLANSSVSPRSEHWLWEFSSSLTRLLRVSLGFLALGSGGRICFQKQPLEPRLRHKLISPASGKREDGKFKACQDYRVNSRPDWATL